MLTAPAKPSFCRYLAGFTLLEVLISLALLALVTVIATPYLFGTQQRQTLIKEQQQLLTVLKETQQRAVIARSGYSYGLDFLISTQNSQQAEAYVQFPEGKKYTVDHGVVLSSTQLNPIRFRKLSGTTEQNRHFILSNSRFSTQVQVSKMGLITSHSVETK